MTIRSGIAREVRAPKQSAALDKQLNQHSTQHRKQQHGGADTAP
jgi:hypothetical protein